MRRIFSLLSAVVLFTACSSRPEGNAPAGPVSGDLPPALYTMFIQSSGMSSALAQGLESELRASGIRVAEVRGDATSILHVSREAAEYRAGGGSWSPISMITMSSSGTGNYQVHYTATYVVIVNGREMAFPDTREVYRNFNGPLNSVPMQADMLARELARDMVREMKRRVASVQQQS